MGRARLRAARRSRRSIRTRAASPSTRCRRSTPARGPEQLDGAWAAVTAEADDARARALWLAETLGLRPFALADDQRALYHAGAAIASNFLVTLYRAASELLEDAGAPPEALVPLMERTIENGFELTGPIARGDWETVDRHLDALHGSGFEQVYDALVAATPRMKIVRTIAELDLPPHGVVGLVPTMGALHDGHIALFRAARPECDVLVASLFVNPPQFSDDGDLTAYPRDLETATRRSRRPRASTCSSSPASRRCTRRASPRGSSRRAPPMGSKRSIGPGTSAASPPSA